MGYKNRDMDKNDSSFGFGFGLGKRQEERSNRAADLLPTNSGKKFRLEFISNFLLVLLNIKKMLDVVYDKK